MKRKQLSLFNGQPHFCPKCEGEYLRNVRSLDGNYRCDDCNHIFSPNMENWEKVYTICKACVKGWPIDFEIFPAELLPDGYDENNPIECATFGQIGVVNVVSIPGNNMCSAFLIALPCGDDIKAYSVVQSDDVELIDWPSRAYGNVQPEKTAVTFTVDTKGWGRFERDVKLHRILHFLANEVTDNVTHVVVKVELADFRGSELDDAGFTIEGAIQCVLSLPVAKGEYVKEKFQDCANHPYTYHYVQGEFELFPE